MYIVWGGNYAPSGVGSHYQIRFSKSTNGGISWAQPTNITSELYDQGNPALAINDTGGLHLTWQGYTSTYTSYNQIRYKKSANLGASWSQTINLTAQSYNSYYVSIICNKSGSPWIAYAARAAAHPSYERIKSRHSRDGVTWSAIVDLDTYASAQGYPSLSSNNNSIVCIWRGRSSSSPSYKQIRKAEYTTSWSATTDLTSGNTHKEYPTTIWANFPNISRLEMDVPKAGYALIYVDNTTLKYMTNGLIWNDFVQSKIVNLGLTDIQGYLLIQVQYFDDSHLPAGWVVDNETVNETSPRIILSGQQLALDTIFNGLINTNDLKHGDGKYRIYAAFRDNRNSPLQLSSENSLTAYWEFDVDI